MTQAENQEVQTQPAEVAEAKPAKAEKAPKEPKPKVEKPVVVKDTKNGVTRPGPDTSTGKVWAISDTLQAAATEEAPITRSAVMKQAEAQGINVSTAATQYGRWRQYNGLGRETAKAVVEKAPKAPKAEKPAEAEVEQVADQPAGETFSL